MDNLTNDNGVDLDIRFTLSCVKCDAEHAYGGPRWYAGHPLPAKISTARFRAPAGWVIYEKRPYCSRHPEILEMIAEEAIRG